MFFYQQSHGGQESDINIWRWHTMHPSSVASSCEEGYIKRAVLEYAQHSKDFPTYLAYLYARTIDPAVDTITAPITSPSP